MILRRPIYVIDVSSVTRVIKLDPLTWMIRERGLYADMNEYRIVRRSDLDSSEIDNMGDGVSVRQAEAVHARETDTKTERQTCRMDLPF